MSWRLTPEERRIIERTRREGEELYASETPAEKKNRRWRSVVAWVGAIVAFVIVAILIYYAGKFMQVA